MRVLLARRVAADTPETRSRLDKALRLLLQMVLPFSLVPGVLLLGYAAIDGQQGRLDIGFDDYLERARWMAIMLFGGALLDTVMAPVRSVDWLESAAAWQGSRTSVLVIGFLVGTPLMLWFGNSQAYLWPWMALRLFADLNGLRPSERERLRLHLLGPDARVFS